LVISLGHGRWVWLVAILLFIGLFAGIPLASLIWKTGLSGSPETWSGHVAYTWLQKNARDRGAIILESLLVGVVSGGLAAGLAVMLCWLAIASRWFQALALALMATVWALPGPILGLGMQKAILIILDVVPLHALSVALYNGPSPLPVAWVNVVRFFPCAVAVLWPVVRLLPAELRDAARVDGARPQQELWHVVLPLALPACLRAGVAVIVLSLGEIAAGKLVATPGSRTFAQEVFDRMHYGVTNDLAALCLILLATVLLGGICVAGLNWCLRKSNAAQWFTW
jgi:ABC-type Fe3+ transport system permease subunit